jgi:RHS repeat-associated protein
MSRPLYIVKDTGMVVGIMGFDPWGLRRTATNWTPLANPLTFDASGVTRHGYTGHEQVDEAGLIHMNGRIYDPKLMRFVQADPIIQSPFDSQSYNRYTYVFNNPLAHTDPTGYWGKEEQGYLRAAVAIVITIYTGGTAAGASWGLLGSSVGPGQAFAVTVIGGAAAGAVQTGTLKGAATGAISGAMFFGVGQYFDAAGWAHLGKDTANALSGTGHAAKTLAHGVAGGITAELGGGNFGNGFLSAGVTQAFAPGIDHIDGGNAGFSVLRTVSAAAVGGTASALSGGKFANGAVTAAFARAFNDEALHFDGKKLRLRGSDPNHRRTIREWNAVSGRPGSSADDQFKEGYGPLPEGTYWVNPKQTDSLNLLDPRDYDWWLTGGPSAWGWIRTPLVADAQTVTGTRYGFFLHGGSVPGSAGCIDLTLDNDSFHQWLETRSVPLPLHVNYPRTSQ